MTAANISTGVTTGQQRSTAEVAAEAMKKHTQHRANVRAMEAAEAQKANAKQPEGAVRPMKFWKSLGLEL